jgi:hypothetical protein
MLARQTLKHLTAFMKILNHKLSSTNEILTARIGLLATAHTINTLSLSNTIDQHRGFKHSFTDLCKALIPWLSSPKRRSQMPIACGVGTL